jgi:EmrB/QacA subfamily drug resistance transporter
MTTTDNPPATPRTGAARDRRPWLVLSLLATAQLMLVLDVTVVNVALPDIGASLDLGRMTVPWVMTTYTLAFGGLMLLGGRVADLAGPRRITMLGLAVFTAASLACGLADSPTMLLAGRAAQGVGAALLSPAALALVLATFAGPGRSKALGVWGALSGVGTVLGVILGGLLTSTLGWRWIFTINIPIGLTVLLALQVLVSAPRRPARREPVDVTGAVLVTAGTGAAIYGLVNAGSHGWTSPSTYLPLVAAVGFWAVFALVERSARAPLMSVGLLGRRPVAAGAFLMLAATGLMVGGFFLGSFALQRAHGYSALDVGLVFLPVAVAVAAGAQSAGRLVAVIPAPAVAAIGLALAGIGNATAAMHAGPVGLVAGLAVAALGIGATFVTAFTVALADADPSVAGLRSAIVTTFHELGGAFGVAVLSSAAGAALTASHPLAHDFTTAYTVAAVAAAVSAVIAAVLVPRVTRSSTIGAETGP